MTTPTRANARSKGGPRTYSWPPNPPYEFTVISVTSGINGGLPKPFLTGWAAKEAAMCAVDDHDVIQRFLDKGDEQAAINHIKGAPFRKRDAAADRGTVVHTAIEAYLAGKQPDEEAILAELKERRVNAKMHKPTLKMVSGLVDFMYDEEPEIILSEKTVFSRTHEYAGTLDMLARMRVGGTVLPVVLDVKTSKSIYNETAYQLTGYARADFVGLDDGTELPLSEALEGGEIEYGIVVRPKPTGGYEKAVFALTDPRLFERFLAMMTVARLAEIENEARRP